jgi:hypothetical protein
MIKLYYFKRMQFQILQMIIHYFRIDLLAKLVKMIIKMHFKMHVHVYKLNLIGEKDTPEKL